MTPILNTLAWLLIVNLLTFACYAWDKWSARHQGWRIPEKSLLLLCFLGGSPAAYIAARRFHHKTTKQPFRTWFMLIVTLQIVVIFGYILLRVMSA